MHTWYCIFFIINEFDIVYLPTVCNGEEYTVVAIVGIWDPGRCDGQAVFQFRFPRPKKILGFVMQRERVFPFMAVHHLLVAAAAFPLASSAECFGNASTAELGVRVVL